ncbi:hypothetical protein TIFTF001_000564 [Ficus carica]|uniref:Uncharacterized protein n=1 Tax=Ficus carica TaxID=3494 RepID=A0AA87YVF2_FICCA|nr:hypothetical protein TIFTF001_000564 [Ficus carica]
MRRRRPRTRLAGAAGVTLIKSGQNFSVDAELPNKFENPVVADAIAKVLHRDKRWRCFSEQPPQSERPEIQDKEGEKSVTPLPIYVLENRSEIFRCKNCRVDFVCAEDLVT